jgi:hypothetical protein
MFLFGFLVGLGMGALGVLAVGAVMGSPSEGD